jgi:hypothetical protein
MKHLGVGGTAARLLRLAGMGAIAAGLAGCAMGSMFGGGPDSSKYANSSASQAEIAQQAPNALPAIATSCPPIQIRPGAETVQYYGGGKRGDPQSLHYQIEFVKQSRSCVVSNGLITAKIGVLGKVLLGPAGNESKVEVPLRIAVERDNAPVFSERYILPVAITPPATSAEFVKVVDNVQIPYVGGEDIVIWVGFDPRGAG